MRASRSACPREGPKPARQSSRRACSGPNRPPYSGIRDTLGPSSARRTRALTRGQRRNTASTTRWTRPSARRSSRSTVSHAEWRHAFSRPPSLTPGSPASSNSRWSELPVPSSRSQSHGHARAPCGGQQLALDPPPRRRRGRAQPERGAAPDLVERERVAQAPPRDDPRQRQRAQVVRRARVDPLLGAGGDEPDVAARRQHAQPRRQGGQQPEPGGVVLGAGAGRDGVGVRHQHPHAGAAAVPDADHVPRRPARRAEALHPHGQPGVAEPVPQAQLGAPLAHARGGARAAASDGDREPVRDVARGRVGDHVRRRRGGSGPRARS